MAPQPRTTSSRRLGTTTAETTWIGWAMAMRAPTHQTTTEVVARLMVGGSPGLASLTPREREVLALMAEGLTNSGIGSRLVVTERTVETHVARILGKLGLAEATPQDHRRVLAVLRYLGENRAG